MTMKKPIFDVDLIPDKDSHPQMRKLKAFIKDNLGGPCPVYCPSCVVCRAWQSLVTLDDIFETSRPKRLSKKEREYYEGLAKKPKKK